MLNQEEIKKYFLYKDGELYWKIKPSKRVKNNFKVGFKKTCGYKATKLEGKVYYIHQLIWIYHYGYLPENLIDHKDKNKLNNIIDNLREVNHQCNGRNCVNPKNNKSTIKGVSFYKRYNKWSAEVRVNYKGIKLGYYGSFDDAVCARLAAEQCLNWSGCDDESPAFKYIKNNFSHIDNQSQGIII